ncbi:ciliary-associated calcium-binding coiled-coil protein 1 [Brachionichthys hirsutus]|uniref:ciliary-associated calcium-binding coiled-coil protein 1 n=1 Tax=Brachionichthys hirsutus TaxID=412623 RepID=UPI0036047A09
MDRHHHDNDRSVNMSETRREKTEALVEVTDNGLQEEGQDVLEWDALSPQQVQELLNKNQADLQAEMQQILGFRNRRTCVKEAAMLDYYVCGFWWAKEAKFTSMQTSFIMAALHRLLNNIEDKGLTFVENLMELSKLTAASCHGSTPDRRPLLSRDEAAALITYTRNSLFQKYRLYELLFSTSREELLMDMERTIEVFGCRDGLTPLEESVPTHPDSQEVALLAETNDQVLDG